MTSGSSETEPSAPTPKSQADIISLCRRVYGRHLKALLFANVFGGAAAICEVLALTLLLLTADTLVRGRHGVSLTRLEWLGLPTNWSFEPLLIVCIVAILVRMALRLGEAFYSARVAADYENEQRLRLVSAFLRTDWQRQSIEPTGRMQVLLTKNVVVATRTLFSIAAAAYAAVNLAVLLTASVAIDWQCALAILVVTTLVFVLLRSLSASSQRLNNAQHKLYMRFANDLGQGIALSRELRTFGVVEPFFSRLREVVGRYRGFRAKQMLLNNTIGPLYQNVALLMLAMGMALIYWTGFERIESLGFVVVLFVRSLAYGQQLQASVHAIHDGVPYLAELRDVEASFTCGTAPAAGRRLPTIATLGMSEVSFAYDPRRPVLCDVSFTVNRGEMVGIVGPSGCGKSTLLHLLLRMYEPDSGAILVNGRPHHEFSTTDWPTRFAFVPQESLMFDESIAESIRFFRPDVTDEDVRRAARQAHLHDEITAFADGFETRVGERGGRLSGGQRQRLSLARALAGRPDVLVLDEPTGALDADSEAVVLRSLIKLKGHVTSLLVSHRPSTLNVCDRVLVLREGRIEAFDTPALVAERWNESN